ncbi:MAG: PAS domain-containing protein [Gemmatimonadota bacterium]|nr:PAS domain-containing protein [Gemmatimonadota bacterium]
MLPLEGRARLNAVVFLADEQQRIVAASTAALEAVRKLGFAGGALVGMDLAAVHGSPAGFRESVADASALPFEHKIKTDHATYKCIVSAVPDGKGGLIGYAVAWEDQTKRQRVEVELGRVLPVKASE